MIVHCSGATTRQCGPGDVVTISGIFLPTRYTVRPTHPPIHPPTYLPTYLTGQCSSENASPFNHPPTHPPTHPTQQGFRALKAGLIADTYLEATDVQRHKKNYSEIDAE